MKGYEFFSLGFSGLKVVKYMFLVGFSLLFDGFRWFLVERYFMGFLGVLVLRVFSSYFEAFSDETNHPAFSCLAF